MFMTSIRKALEALDTGKMIAVYDSDSREGETDLMFHAKFADAGKIETLRKDAGGLICLAVSPEIAGRLGLEFYSDVVRSSASKLKCMDCKKTAYGDKPAFSIPINHKGVYTGITDIDRSLTIRKFHEVAMVAGTGGGTGGAKKRFMAEFYTPGHVFLLIGRGLEKRRGHTELSLALAEMTGLPGTMVLCEMLGKGKALPKAEVKRYCRKHDIEFLEGRDIYG
jgi:3,4-dihydroxy 2-butanone 4-phosphate synthase